MSRFLDARGTCFKSGWNKNMAGLLPSDPWTFHLCAIPLRWIRHGVLLLCGNTVAEEKSSGELVIARSEVVVSDLPLSPEFIQDLLPSAERTALLYHLSYLCLGGFPKLERLIRERALETQLLFGSSEAVLMKCVGTSSNLVTSLFPILMKAIENNKCILAVKYLEKARTWINDIIRAMDDMVKSYEQQSRSVASCTSDVIQEQKKTEGKLTQNSEEMKSLEEAVAKLEEELTKCTENVDRLEKKIEGKSLELQDHIKAVSRESHGMSILAVLVPFIGPLIKSIYDTATAPGVAAQTQSLNAELSRLTSEKNNLQNKEWNIQVKETDLQLKLATSRIQMGVIPDLVHMNNVQKCLSRIQQILVQLKMFWEKVGAGLDTLKKKTFVGEELIDDLDVLKEEFLTSIEAAGKYWQRFGECCQRAQVIFSIQSRTAYNFLEVNPSSLSQDERNKQYESIMAKLRKINPQGSSRAAITE